jgi:replicative DNA helicase
VDAESIVLAALSQLARPKDGDINSRPTMLSFKESGDIEAHAHVALLLYQPVDNDQPTGEDEIIIGKNRHGALGSIKVVFDKQRLQFEDREVKHGQANGASAAGQAGAR